ncbi:methyltransferase domain-containing protein [Pseudonocardia sp.]|uniref:methyltransferase domain-containing protein n=1 Tax=Pseudonocardia sp. TaxID=60912 RepID=UPI003D096D56
MSGAGDPTHAVRRVLERIVDPHGTTPLPWAVGPLAGARTVLEIGPGVLDAELGERRRWLDPEGRVVERGGPAPLPRTLATPWPLATNAVDGICLLLALSRLVAIDRVFAEIRRVLRPAGTLVVLTPSVTLRTVPELRLARLLRPVRRGAWPNRSGLDNAGWLLAAADFAVMADDRMPFALPLPDPAAALEAVETLPAAGLWPPLPADVAENLAVELAERCGPDRVLPVPVRRLVARR